MTLQLTDSSVEVSGSKFIKTYQRDTVQIPVSPVPEGVAIATGAIAAGQVAMFGLSGFNTDIKLCSFYAATNNVGTNTIDFGIYLAGAIQFSMRFTGENLPFAFPELYLIPQSELWILPTEAITQGTFFAVPMKIVQVI